MPHFLDRSYCRHQPPVGTWSHGTPSWGAPTQKQMAHSNGPEASPSPERCSFKIQPSPFSVQPGNFHFERPMFREPRFSTKPQMGTRWYLLPACNLSHMVLRSNPFLLAVSGPFLRSFTQLPGTFIRPNAYLFPVPLPRHALLRVLHPPTTNPG